MPVLGEDLAPKLAAELGDLPLAAGQAAGYLEQTDLPPGDYLRRFRTHRAGLLARGDVVGYSGRIDTAWALSRERLRCQDPAAVQLLELAALLAPEPIPLSLLGGHPELLDEPLRRIAADPDDLADTVGALVGYSLARRSPDGFQVPPAGAGRRPPAGSDMAGCTDDVPIRGPNSRSLPAIRGRGDCCACGPAKREGGHAACSCAAVTRAQGDRCPASGTGHRAGDGACAGGVESHRPRGTWIG